MRVSPSGAKTFSFRYKRNDVVRFLTIGTYPATTLRMAYEAHAELIKQLNRGEVPSLKQDTSVPGQLAALRDQGPTVGELAEEFLKRYVYRERKRPEDAARTIEQDILKHWRHRPARAITRRDGVLLLDKVVDRGAPVMANRVAALLVQMFSFGVNRGMLDATPFTGVPRPGGTEKSRKRRLSEAEVRTFWRRLTRSRLSFEVRTGLKLILVTAQRPGEVALAESAEFDLERRLWTIPAERSKNGQPHEVPLNDLAIILLV
jgi:integrase